MRLKFELNKTAGRSVARMEIENCDVARLLPFEMTVHSDAKQIV
jgi:hypothetical protein